MKEATKAIQVLCGNLDNMKRALAITIEDAQEPLRAFVIDKEFPLEHRFEAWAEWCDKTHHGWVIHEDDVPLFGKMVDDGEPFGYERYEERDWLFFLEIFTDGIESEHYMKKYGVTVDDVKELLIEQNFGSFRMNW